MSDLQIILIVIGMLIIIGVLIFNWWQERRFYRQVENSFSSVRNDALLDDPKLDISHLHYTLNDESVVHPTFDKLPSEQTEPEHTATFSQDMLEQAQLPTQEIALTAEYISPPNEAPINQIAEDISAIETRQNADALKSAQINLPNNINNSIQYSDIKLIFNEAFNKVGSEALQVVNPPVVVASAETLATVAHDNEDHDAQVETAEAPALTLPAMLHPQMDLTAVLYLAKETPVNTLSSEFATLLSGYDKSVFVHALNAEKQWLLLKDMQADRSQASVLISKIACSLQLADRAGAVSRNTLNRFQLAVETLGLDINAHVEWQGTGDALLSATELDAFCIEVDKTIGFHLVNGDSGAFTGTKLRGLAEAQGLVLSSDGTFKYFDPDAPKDEAQLQPSFVMFNREDYPFSPDMLRTSVVKGITFQLDIPRVKHCAEAYSQMVLVARQMELGLKALLVAENNKVLGDIQIEKVRQQLKVIHATMLTRAIVPGSNSALRLFS